MTEDEIQEEESYFQSWKSELDRNRYLAARLAAAEEQVKDLRESGARQHMGMARRDAEMEKLRERERRLREACEKIAEYMPPFEPLVDSHIQIAAFAKSVARAALADAGQGEKPLDQAAISEVLGSTVVPMQGGPIQTYMARRAEHMKRERQFDAAPEARPAPLAWSSEPPTEAGLYVRRLGGTHGVHRFCAEDVAYVSHWYPANFWFGPIPEPGEPGEVGRE